uniref:NADH dehydrogenase subunit 6 n=1 Tax=Pissodes yunnanensis TaxID=1723750 RepID=UPI00207ADFB1|nr:NADH dehydrogenase subunit 6 [Pissodes yunnanensis]URP30506.1 NADH dehydrogenase subunit 6 [Pissodes yunnanensis]
MLTYLLICNWMLSMIFIFLNHPLSLGCVLLLQTILISLSTGFLYYNFWFSYILFMIMIGGMLIMFIYMTSIASNEKFSLPKNLIIFTSLLGMIFLLIIISQDNFYSKFLSMNFMNMSQSIKLINLTLNKYYNYPNMQIMIILMIYLFITLIAIVKITNKSPGTLRQK